VSSDSAIAIAKQLDRAVGLWRRAYLIIKPLEQRVEAARARFTELLVAAGVKGFDSKHGTINLETKKTTNWEALARSVIASKFVDELVPQFTSESKPYVRAPQRWAGEAKR
jgi:hypothetical protein